MAIHYGIDVGGTKIEFGVFDKRMNKLSVERQPTQTTDYEQFIETLSKFVKDADTRNCEQGTIGIGLPCVIDYHGLAVSSNIPCINGKELCSDIEQALSRPVSFGNDCETFIVSEAHSGAGKAYGKVLGVILGTGVNAKLYEHGKLLTSNNKIAGEWGHTIISALHQQRYDLPLRKCGCGGVGCLERYVSGNGLEWLYQNQGGSAIKAEIIIAQMRQGHSLAKTAFEQFLDILAYGVAQLVLYYDPDAIVIGGGLSKVTEIYKQLPDIMSGYLFKGMIIPKILPAKHGDSSGVRGAAILGHNAH